jgi:hypothetical protein
VSDIEKLINKKIELEPFEVEDDRPRRPPRPRLDDEPRREREPAYAAPRAPAPVRAPAPQKNRDPFFDKPYEASTATVEKPEWEMATPSQGVGRPSLSANIRAKRKVASLLGGGKA